MPVLTDSLGVVLSLDPTRWNAGLRSAEQNYSRFLASVNKDVRQGKQTQRLTELVGPEFGPQAEAVSERLARIQTGARYAGLAAGALGAGMLKAVSVAGRMEQIKIAFTTIEGSAAAADARIKELQQFSLKTPFDFEQTVKSAQALRGMGVESAKLIPLLTDVGNAVSATGGGTEAFQGVLRQIGQIQTKGRVMGEELSVIAEHGIPAYQILQEELGLTAAQMQDIGRQGITAEKAIGALQRGMQKRYTGAMEAQSKTLLGSLSNLRDGANQLAGALGSPLVGPLTIVTKSLTDLTGSVNALPKPTKDAIAWVGVGLAGAAGLSWLWLKYLEAQNTRLMNSMLKTAVAAKLEADALKNLGNQARGAGGQMGGGGVPLPGGNVPGSAHGLPAKGSPKLPGTLGRWGIAGGAAGLVGKAIPGLGWALTAYELAQMVDQVLPKDAKGLGGKLRRGSDAAMNLLPTTMLWNAATRKDHDPFGDLNAFRKQDLGLYLPGEKRPGQPLPGAPGTPPPGGKPEPKSYSDMLREQQVALLKEQNELLRGIKDQKFPFDAKDVPVGEQLALIGLGHAIA